MTIRDPQIEFVLAQHPWLENDCIYADIVLPTNTYLEVDDIMPCVRDGEHFQTMLNMRKAVEPIGDSKSDFEAVVEVAKKLGMEEKVTIGRTVDQYIEGVYKGMNFDKIVSWEEFQEKDYMVIPVSKNWKNLPAGLYEFYKDPVKNPLPTPTGKLEFCSTNLEKYFPNDEERPPYPQWIEKGITHDERRSSSRARTYPLLAITNHPRWRVHAQADDIPWTKEADTGKVRGFDGYLYETSWIHPSDAEEREKKNGDIVRVFNERGSVLCGALVFERIIPGAVSIDHGARTDIIIPGKLDRGGAINTITPKGLTSRYAGGQATTSFLVEVERVSMKQYDEWKTHYPEAWNRDYDRASGLKASAWVERGCK
jgi:trimethylamine-N-oxide reductase (cytochrome c)